MMEKQQMEVWTFSSMDEVRRSVPNFIADNPLSQINYKRLIGDYNFIEEACCCFLKENGSLCNEGHKKGWVAELQDGSATIIGNHCAKQKFGAESKFIADRSRYINELRIKQQLSALKHQMDEKTERLARLNQLEARLRDLEGRVSAFTDQLGSFTLFSLQAMQRSGNPSVNVTLVRIRESVNKHGNVTGERSAFSHTLGSLRGLDLIQPNSFSTLYRVIKSVGWAYRDADRLPPKSKSSEIASLANRLNEYDSAIRDGNRLIELERDFFSNQFFPLCYLSTDKGDRFKAARIAMRQLGISGTKDDAKAWLAEQEKAIKKELSVDAIELR
jgi:hypothetical protein